jgi:hypothetical protein
MAASTAKGLMRRAAPATMKRDALQRSALFTPSEVLSTRQPSDTARFTAAARTALRSIVTTVPPL